MERVFADTGYWIALLNPRDDLHEQALAASRDLGPKQIGVKGRFWFERKENRCADR